MRTMEKISPQEVELSDAVLGCFRQACSERRLNVAEHLLVALEQLSMDRSDANNLERHVHLAEAYGLIVELTAPRQSVHPCK